MKPALKKDSNFKNYLKPTEILDFRKPVIQSLIRKRGWDKMPEIGRVNRIYTFVKDEIKFGYNKDDAISASEVLSDGFGQCNTKANLFMALLRGVGIPNRIHGFTIYKALQKGAITGIWYTLSPTTILHSWVEVYVDQRWFNLEGIILDEPYLKALQEKFSDCRNTFCGYGVFTDHFQHPEVEWNRNHTYIQKNGINQDFGLFDTPDEFYIRHKQKLNPFKKWVYQNYVRHVMNRNVERIRKTLT